MTVGTELPNQNKIKAFGEMEAYKSLGILKADTIKYTEMKKIPHQNENVKPNY